MQGWATTSIAPFTPSSYPTASLLRRDEAPHRDCVCLFQLSLLSEGSCHCLQRRAKSANDVVDRFNSLSYLLLGVIQANQYGCHTSQLCTLSDQIALPRATRMGCARGCCEPKWPQDCYHEMAYGLSSQGMRDMGTFMPRLACEDKSFSPLCKAVYVKVLPTFL